MFIIFTFRKYFTPREIVIDLKKMYFFCANIILWNKNHTSLSKNKSVCMCKESWFVGLGQERGSLHEGGENCMKYLKRWWKRKEGSGNKKFKKESQAGLSGGCLLVQTMYIYEIKKHIVIFHKYFVFFKNLLQFVWIEHLTKSLYTQQKIKN